MRLLKIMSLGQVQNSNGITSKLVHMKFEIVIKTAALIAAICLLSGCGGETPATALLEEAGMEKPIIRQELEEADSVQSEEELAQELTLLEHYIVAEQPLPFALHEPVVDVKGIYVSASVAGSPDIFEKRVEVCNTTESNAMVIDIKETDGLVTFENGIPFADELGTTQPKISDIHKLVADLKENGIYTIARIVAFKDNAIIEKYPEYGIRMPDGSIFRESQIAWLNPYNRDVWEYTLEIAKGAAQLGFDEIQFDYFRFPTSSKIKDADFGDTEGLSKMEIITEFAEYAVKQLRPYGVKVSVDVYGTIILSDIDAAIVGQDYVALCKIFDFVSPMIYPSHFAPNSMNIDYPDLNPYETIYQSLQASNERLQDIEGHVAIIRPWLQDFTASYLKSQGIPFQSYEKDQVREQINAVYDAGLSQWLLWSTGGRNTVEALLPAEDGETRAAEEENTAEATAWAEQNPDE